MVVVTRQVVIDSVSRLGLDIFDQEDLEQLLDDLLGSYTPLEAYTWLSFQDSELGGIPIVLIGDGKVRDVVAQARRMVESKTAASTP